MKLRSLQLEALEERQLLSLTPEIAVYDGGMSDVWDDTSYIYFQTTGVGTPVTETFTIDNLGTGELTLDSASLVLPAGFSVVTPFAETVAPGGSTSLVVELDAVAGGYYSGWVSFATNDADENPFDFHVSGEVTAPQPEISVMVDGYEVYDDDFMSSVYFGPSPVSSPVAKTFTVHNTGTADLTLDATSLSVPAGFSVVTPPAETVAPGGSTSLAVQLDASVEGFYDGQIIFNNNDGDENPFNIYVSGDVTGQGGGVQPEIEVLDAALMVINDGTGLVTVGTTTVGVPINYMFTIYNQGQGDLTLDPASLVLPSGFSLVSAFDSFVVASGETTFTVQLDAASAGTYSGEVSFTNDDADENPFNFTVSGEVQGGAGGGPEIAVWDSGTVEVFDGSGSVSFGSTLEGSPLQRSFTIENWGDAELTLDPASLVLPGGFSLVSPFAGTVAPGLSTSFSVQLDAVNPGSYSGTLSFSTNDSDENPFDFTVSGEVTPLPAPEIDVRDGASASIVDGTGSVDLGSTTEGTPLEETFTIHNTGTADLTLDTGSLTVPAGYSVVSTFAATVASSGQTSLTLRLDASSPGTYGGEVSFANNDGDENPFNFTITGEVLPDNSAPVVAHPIGDAVVEEGTASTLIELSVVFDDVDIPGGDSLAYSVSHDNSSLLSATLDGSALTLAYLPGQLGTSNVAVRATDTEGEYIEDVFIATVIPALHTPFAFGNSYRVDHDSTLVVSASDGVLADDFDPDGDALVAIEVTGPASGVLTLNADGSLTYAPNSGFTGSDGFTYKASDGTYESGVVTVTVEVTNETPQAGGNTYEVGANSTLTVDASEGFLVDDSDPEGDALTATLVDSTTHGNLTFGSDGSFTYTPDAGFLGTDTFSYRAGDGLAESAIATVTIEVGNGVPAGVADWYRVTHDLPLSVAAPGVLANDVDPEDDALEATLGDPAAHGTVVVDTDGSFTYTPDAGYVGADSFTYRTGDAFGQSDLTTVTLEVVNHAPVARADAFYVLHDSTLSPGAAEGVLTGDSDADGDAITAALVSSPANGTLALNPDGSFAYTPGVGFVGSDSFSYTASDGLADSAAVTVTLTVFNSAPAAFEDRYSVHAGDSLLIPLADGVLAGDFDADGDALEAILVSGVAAGTLGLAADGSFSYAPNSGFVGTDSFTYKASDGAQETEPTTVTIEVTNTAPWAVDARFSLEHDATLTVNAPGLLDFAGDADEDGLSVSLVDDVTSGSLILGADGSFSYTPSAGFSGTDSFTYTAGDGFTESASATVTLEVTNSAPLAGDDYYSVSHDTVLTVTPAGVLANDFDADTDSLSITANGSPQHGSLTLSADGSFTYTPNAGYLGSDGFTYTVSDGAAQATGTVSIEVVNGLPLSEDDAYGVLADASLSVVAASGVLVNDTDFDGDVMTVALVTDVSHGTLSLETDGAFTYTPDVGYLGTDSFTYKANDGTLGETYGDGNTARVTITVYADSVVAEGDTFEIVHDRELAGDVVSNDFNWNEVPVSAVLVGGASNGSLVLNADGSFTYTPNAQFAGTDSFTYQLDDAGQLSNVATVTIEVRNTAPVASDATYWISHDQTLNVDVPGITGYYDDAESDALSLTLVDDVTQGLLTLNADGSFTYTPNAGFVGEDGFRYRVNDGVADSNTATVTIEVTNTAPVSFDDSYETHYGTLLDVIEDGVLANDQDSDGDALTATLVADVTHGSLALNADGTFSYTPAAGYVGEDSFTYYAGDGVADGNVVAVTLRVTNTGPTTSGDSYEATHDASLVVDVAAGVLDNDSDWDGDALVATLVDGPAHGSVTFSGDGSFTYTPDPAFVGEDGFTYSVDDGAVESVPVTVSITVQNTVPLARPDAFTVGRNGALAVGGNGVLANDVDLDDDSLTATLQTDVSNGALTLAADGTFSYTPNAGYVGTDSFTYFAGDDIAQSGVVAVEIAVLNAAPVATGDFLSVAHDTTLNASAGELTLNDFDLNGDALTASLTDNVGHGSLTFNTDGSFSYTPDGGFVGLDHFTYQLSDGVDQSEPVWVKIEVVNSQPLAHDLSYRVLHDATLTVEAGSGLIATSSDAEEDALGVSVISGVNHGTLTVNSDGSFTYAPDAAFVGSDGFTYQVSDSLLSSTTASVRIDVTNTPPSAMNDIYTMSQDGTLTVAAPGVLENDADLDGEVRTVSLLDDVGQGTLTLNADGSFTYSPESGYAGIESFTYKISDGVAFDYGRVFIEVAGTHANPTDIPTARNDIYRVSHGQTLQTSLGEGLLANDVDPNGDSLTAVLVAGPTQGALTLNGDGSFDYTPTDANFVGTDSFTYKANDGSNDSSVATVTIDVVNGVPTAGNTAYAVHHGTELIVTEATLLLACFDDDDDTLTASVVSTTSHGALTLGGDGTFTYTPEAGFIGTDSFTYKVSDGVVDSNVGTVVIDVTNTVPSASDRYYRIRHGEVLDFGDVLSTAGDADGDSLTATLDSGASNGSVTVSADGTFTYTPNAGFAGSDSFTFRVHDGAEWSHAMPVVIDVVNTAPDAADAGYAVHHGTSLEVQPNVWDAEGDDLVLELVGDVEHGSLTFENQVSGGTGGEPIRFTGKVTYTPDAGYTGSDAFVFRANDGVTDGSEATVTFNVTNVIPVGVDLFFQGNPEEPFGAAAPGLLRDVWDADEDSLTLALVSDVSNGTLVLAQQSGEYTGGFTYTPDPGFVGVDSFTYQVDDGAETSELITVTLNVVNNEPRAFGDVFRFHHTEADAGGAYHFQLDGPWSTAFDPDEDPLTFIKTSDPASGTVTVASDGSVTYTPADPDFIGTDVFTYKVSDGYAESAEATVTIRVENSTPTAVDNHFSIKHGATLSIPVDTLIGSGFDLDGDELTLLNVSAVSDGTLTYDSQQEAYVYNPGGFVGTASFTYQLDDGAELSEVATASIEVVNTAPWALGGSYSGRVGELLTVPSLADRNAAWDLEDGVSAELVSVTPAGALDPADFLSDGSFTLTPDAVGTVTVTFKVTDGYLESDPAEITIQVVEDEDDIVIDDGAGQHGTLTFPDGYDGFPIAPYYEDGYTYAPPTIDPENAAPVATADGVYEALHGTEITPSGLTAPSLLFNDFDPDNDPLTLTLVTPSSHGTVTLESGGGFTYTPGQTAAGYDYVGDDSFEYSISDGHYAPVTAWATVRLTNQQPTVWGESFEFERGTGGYSGAVPAGDPDGDPLEYTVDAISAGSVSLGTPGFFDFTPPDSNWTGTSTIDFTVTDTAGASASGTFSVTIVEFFPPEGDYELPPVANDDSYKWRGVDVSGSVTGNDVEGLKKQGSVYTWRPITVTTTGPQAGNYGTLDLNSGGGFTYTVTPGMESSFINLALGAETFNYTIQDTSGATDSAEIKIEPWPLHPGETITSAFGDIRNGFRTPWPQGPYENGLGSVWAWFENGAARVQPADGFNFVVDVEKYDTETLDLEWSGNASYLDLSVDGDVLAPIAIGGYLKLFAGGDVLGDVSAGDLRVGANGSLQNVSATNYVVDVATPGELAPPNPGSGDIGSVVGGSRVFSVVAGGNLLSVQSTNGAVGWVEAAGDLGPVTSALWIGQVYAGGDITGAVTASGDDIGFHAFSSQSGLGLYRPVPEISYREIGGVFAGGDILGPVSAPSGAVAVVHAEQNINASINAGQSIYFVRAEEGSIVGDVTATNHVGLVDAEQNVDGQITASTGHVGRVRSGEDILRDVTSAQAIAEVAAGKSLVGSVVANGGPIFAVQAGAEYQDDGKRYGSILSQQISATGNIGSIASNASVGCGGDMLLAGGITAGGYIGDVTADGDLQSQITAATWIGGIKAGMVNEGGITGPITATSGWIGPITAKRGGINGTINADTDVRDVWARDSINGDITAQGSVAGVTSEKGGIADVSGPLGIGNVSAGTSITGNLTSSLGGIGEITAGSDTFGDISGTILAQGNIAEIAAYAEVEEQGESTYSSRMGVYLNAFTAALNDPNVAPGDLPKPPRIDRIAQASGGGSIQGSVTAHGSIGSVTADAEISGPVAADWRLNTVWARSDISGDITFGEGSLEVTSWASVSGNTTGVGNVSVWAYDDLPGNVTSTSGTAKATTWASLTGPVVGQAGASAAAYDSIASSQVASSQGAVSAVGYGDVMTTVHAAKSVGLGVLGAFRGVLISDLEKVFAGSLEGLEGKIQAHEDVVAVSLGAIRMDILSNLGSAKVVTDETLKQSSSIEAKESILVAARNDVSGTFHSTEGSIYINADSVSDSTVTADQADVAIDSYGPVTGTSVTGRQPVVVRAMGDVSGSITSLESIARVTVREGGNLDAAVTANGQSGGIEVVAWGDITQKLEAANGPVYAFAYGNVSGKVEAGGDVELNTWGNVTGKVKAGGAVEVFARNDVTCSVEGGESVSVVVGGSVSGGVTAGTGPGHNATITAVGDVTGTVKAGGSATVEAWGSVQGDVTASAGSAIVAALGNYDTGTVKAGANAAVSAGGNVVNATVKADADVTVGAHGNITTLAVKSGRNASVNADIDASTVTINAGGEAVLGAIQSISAGATVQAGSHVAAFAGTTASLDAKSDSGDVLVTSIGDLSGTFEAGDEVHLATFGSLSAPTVNARSGAASVFARVSVTQAGVTSPTSVTAVALEDVSGTFDATGGVTSVFAGRSFQGTATGMNQVAVVAGDGISGSVGSSDGNAAAASLGAGTSSGSAGISATVTAHRNATATAVLGSVGNQVTATYGDAVVTAGASVTAGVSAGGNATVFAAVDISGGTIQAGGDATAAGFGEISSNVTALGGHAVAVAGTDLSGAVTGELDAVGAARTGSVTGDVTATTGSAAAIAGKDVSGAVSARQHALAAALGSVTGNVAGADGNASVIAGGTVSGSVSAGLSAGVIARGSVTGSVSAGLDAGVATLDSQLGAVSAGRDAAVIFADTAAGAVSGGRHAAILGYGLVTAPVTATTGDAVVVTWGGVNNSISAGDSAFVAAGATTDVAVTAASDAFVQSFGTTVAFVDAGRDALVWSAGSLGGSLGAGRDAALISLASSIMGVTAGRDAFVWTFDKYQSNVTAGQDAFVVSAGAIHAGVTAGRDGGMYAIDYAIGWIDAERYAGLVTWGTAAGPMVVDGAEGAYGWAYLGFSGDVRSSGGDAFLGTHGNAVGNVMAGGDALAAVVGHFVGTVTGAGYAGAVTLGDFNGSLSAGADGFIVSGGSVSAGMTTGGDLAVWAIGDVTGNYHAGRDASVVTYGDFGASLDADRDIGAGHYNYYGSPGVWARGDIHGRITAGRNIGHWDHYYGYSYDAAADYDIFSFGRITAVIRANNPSGSPVGGRIGSVAAWDEIDGLIQADHSIQLVRSGGPVNATVIAPYVGSIIEHDSTITTAYPYPTTPDSIKPEVLAEAQAAYDAVLAARSGIADDISALLADFAAQKTQALADLAEQQAAVDAVLAETAMALQDKLDDDIDATFKTQTAAARASSEEIAKLRELAHNEKEALEEARDAAKSAGDAAYQRALDEKDKIIVQLTDFDRQMLDLKTQEATAAANEREVRQNAWDEYRKELLTRPPSLDAGNPGALWDLFADLAGWENPLAPWFGWLPWDIDLMIKYPFAAAGAFVTTLDEGAASTADGIIPFWDPFESYYANPDGSIDSAFIWSRGIAAVSRDLLLISQVPNITLWLKNPVYYEIGSTTVSKSVLGAMGGMNAIEKGRYMVQTYGWFGWIVQTAPSQFGATIWTGLTPGAWLSLIGVGEALDYRY